MKRKLLATLLALCLIVGMIPVAASAEIIRVEDTETLWNEETDSFRIYDDYWSDIVAEIPEGYVQDEVQKTVQLSTPESLVWFGKEVNSGKSFAGYTITVTNDIDMSGHYWTPIDTATIQYNDENGSWSTIEPQKKLDGATITGGEEGHTITGLATSTGLRGPNQSSEPGDGQNCYYYSAFIGRNDGALTVQNLTFENASIAMTEPDDGVASNGSSMCATVVALNSGTLTLDSVSVVGSNILAMQKAAALVAYTTSSLVVQQCEVADNTISAYFQVAPVVGYSAKNNLSLKGIVLNNNTIRAIEQQGDSWNYTIDEEGNQYYQYGNDNLWYYNAGEVAVFSDGESGSSTQGSGLEMVAEVNGYQYSTIQSAIESAEAGQTVVLLKDTEESVSIASSDDIVLDLNGNVLTLPSTMTVDGNVTVQDSTVTAGPVVSSDYESVEYDAGKIVYTGNSTAIIPQNGGSFTLLSGIIDASVAGNAIYANGNRSPENGGNTEPVNTSVTIAGGYIHSMEYGIGIAGRGAQLSVSDGVIAAEGNTAIGGNGTNSASRYDGGTTINISGGTIIGRMTAEFVEDGYIAVGIYHPQNGEMTISGGTIYADQGVGIAMRGGTLDFTGGSIISTGSASGKVGDSKVTMDCYGIQVDGDSGYYDYANCKVTISGSASVSSQSGVDSIIVTPAGDEDKITVSGGYFTSDPSAYLADDLVAVPSDMPGYAFTVGEAVETEVEPAVGNPTVEMGNGIKDEDKDTIETVAKTVTAGSGELAAAANDMLKDADDSKEAAIKEYQNSEIEGASGANNVNVYAQTYLSVTPTAYDSTNKTLTMDITPMYRVVASTKDNPEDIKVVGEVDEGANAVVLDGSEKPLENINTMTISVTLPAEFASKTVYIQHKGYEYSATADADCKITFTNPHGFSEFTFTTDSKTVATIDGTSYTSLQAAVDDATSDDIIVVKNGNVDLSATANKTVTIQNGTGSEITVSVNGVSRTIGENETETFVYTSGGGTPSEPEEPTWPFTDVTEGDDWFYDAVAYVYENGIMAGTDETIFEPYMELDRAQAAQLFYNLEGKPAVTGDSAFTDVTSGHWAVDAITWAAQNDIVAGIGGGLYDPDSNVTREQFAQMLYNYAQYKGYDLTATGDLTQFPDADAISSWAETALSWANGKGLINGHENGTIDPKGSTIRAQAASIMANFDQNVAK